MFKRWSLEEKRTFSKGDWEGGVTRETGGKPWERDIMESKWRRLLPRGGSNHLQQMLLMSQLRWGQRKITCFGKWKSPTSLAKTGFKEWWGWHPEWSRSESRRGRGKSMHGHLLGVWLRNETKKWDNKQPRIGYILSVGSHRVGHDWSDLAAAAAAAGWIYQASRREKMRDDELLVLTRKRLSYIQHNVFRINSESNSQSGQT